MARYLGLEVGRVLSRRSRLGLFSIAAQRVFYVTREWFFFFQCSNQCECTGKDGGNQNDAQYQSNAKDHGDINASEVEQRLGYDINKNKRSAQGYPDCFLHV